MTSNRPRVLVTTHLFPSEVTGLSGPWLAEQVDALERFVDVTVLAALRECRNRDETRLSGVGVRYRATQLVAGDGRLSLVAAAGRYAWIARRELQSISPRQDVLHAHFGFPDAVIASRVAHRLGIPLVVTLHGDDAFDLARRESWLGKTIRQALNSAAGVICVSPAMAEAVRPILSKATQVTVIENGYDSRLFRIDDLSEQEPPARAGLLFVGTLTRVKNVDVLLRAYARLDEHPGLTVVGVGPLKHELQALSEKLGISDSLVFLGELTREQVAEQMKHAKALVIPSASEGYGMVAAEALASGTPVVASNVGGLPGILQGQAAGVLVQPGSEASLLAGLEATLSVQHDPHEVSRASSARPWDDVAVEISQLYTAVLSEHGHRFADR